jgi:hypothetical protein
MNVRFAAALLWLFPAAVLAQGPAKVDFERQVWPILERRCIECHGTQHTGPDGKVVKPKGRVVLDSLDGITTSKRGRLVVANEPDQSLILESISLPADDEDRMPPAKTGDPLTPEQIELIRRWIAEGAPFGKWTGKASQPEEKEDEPKEGTEKGKPAPGGQKETGQKAARIDPLPKLQKGLTPLPAAALAAFAEGPFTVASIGDGSPLLRVTCASHADAVDDQALSQLKPLCEHVTELDLGRSRVGDEGCKVIALMPRLTSLDLRQTEVGNHGVAALGACKELRSLNLFGTKTGDYAMTGLGSLKNLEQLYVWQTEVSPAAVVRLREAVPGVRVVFAAELPDPMTEAPAGGNRRRQ